MGLLPMEADILPPSDDRIFKLILTSPEAKPALMDLISAIIKRPVVDVAVHYNEIPVSDTREKAERLDVNCRIDDGSQVNLEMQANPPREVSDGEHRTLKGKSIYYLCDLHSSQPSKGMRRYDDLARTYQVTFCSYTIFPRRKGYTNSFSVRHDEDNELLSDALRIIFVEMSKLDEIMKRNVDEMTDLEKWAIFFQYADKAAHRETVNKIVESKEALQMASDLLMSISTDERERAAFRSRRKFETDYASDMATSEDIGEERGRREGALAIARNALQMGIIIDDIVKLTGLSREEIEKLEN
jgi:predicted transposase/invertase (TIGR01784 family)